MARKGCHSVTPRPSKKKKGKKKMINLNGGMRMLVILINFEEKTERQDFSTEIEVRVDFFYNYELKPSLSLDNGLVHLKTQADVDDMIKWVRGVREIGMYVTHLSGMIAKNMLLLEMYNSLRSKWPKATLKEIDDEKARLLGFEEGVGCKHDDKVEGVTVGKVMFLEWYHIEECEQGGELQGVK
ncbi:hypothetical protein LIER_41546 [Lithospermum erythrorhizon]|uniref:Uncharacterized protein n=1 Tax=Lithospermum erythrorhizon TaxID=34254 RepID=A0AAV3RE22_LITER